MDISTSRRLIEFGADRRVSWTRTTLAGCEQREKCQGYNERKPCGVTECRGCGTRKEHTTAETANRHNVECTATVPPVPEEEPAEETKAGRPNIVRRLIGRVQHAIERFEDDHASDRKVDRI
uniref:hypothetical protein n=1 Tax=Nonomuraea sp. CA-251285 TaxID=3240002 RepID=UPI003F495D06